MRFDNLLFLFVSIFSNVGFAVEPGQHKTTKITPEGEVQTVLNDEIIRIEKSLDQAENQLSELGTTLHLESKKMGMVSFFLRNNSPNLHNISSLEFYLNDVKIISSLATDFALKNNNTFTLYSGPINPGEYKITILASINSRNDDPLSIVKEDNETYKQTYEINVDGKLSEYTIELVNSSENPFQFFHNGKNVNQNRQKVDDQIVHDQPTEDNYIDKQTEEKTEEVETEDQNVNQNVDQTEEQLEDIQTEE